MKNLGEILQEARKAKGVSLRDAADATKIRSDFLGNMEQGDFSFDLPEIYRRGFLRLYAEYLGLDENTIMADYNAFVSGARSDKDSQKSNPAKSQFFSKLTEESEEPLSASLRYENEPQTGDFGSGPATPLERGIGKVKKQYVKIGSVFAAVAALVVVIVVAVSTLSSGPDAGEATAQQSANTEFIITITPIRDTYYTLSAEANPNDIKFQGEALRGKVRVFPTKETLVLYPKNLEDLAIDRNGAAIDLSKAPRMPKYRLLAPNPAQ